MGAVLRRDALRVAWLMVGAAIGLAAVLLLAGLGQVVAPGQGWLRVVVIALLLLPVTLLGLLPGVRDLEVTAARTMLGVRTELVLPERPTATHRRRTVVTVLLHLVLGLLAGVLLFAALPAVVAAAFARLSAAAAVGAALLAVAIDLVILVALGRVSVSAVARLLGPSTGDRLVVALQRLEAEAAHTRLARELHDGIGHALTVIGLQATAGQRVLRTDPGRTEDALGTIEDTARGALAELDDMLGSLRSGAVVRETAPGLDRLDALLTTYRDGGLSVEDEIDELPWLPPLTSSTAYRVVAEGLTNAVRHAGSGTVRLRVATTGTALHVRVTSPLPERRAEATAVRGLGLTGVGERVRLLGGRSSAGPDGGVWVLAVDLPRAVGGG